MDPDQWAGVILGGTLALALLFCLCIAALSSLETAVRTARRSRLALRPDNPEVARAIAIVESSDAFEASAHLAQSLCEAIVYTCTTLAGMQLAVRFQTDVFPNTLVDLF